MTAPMSGRAGGIPVAGLPSSTPLARLVTPLTGRARGYGDRACSAGLQAGGTFVGPGVPSATQAGARLGRSLSAGRSAGRAATLPAGVHALSTRDGGDVMSLGTWWD